MVGIRFQSNFSQHASHGLGAAGSIVRHVHRGNTTGVNNVNDALEGLSSLPHGSVKI